MSLSSAVGTSVFYPTPLELLDIRSFSKSTLEDEMRPNLLKRAAVVSPSGNITAVVFDQLLKSDRKALGDSIMGIWKSQRPDQEIEQCCFVTKPENPRAIGRVEMFGGEFCGNATRSVVWLLTEGKDYSGLIEVSGVSKPLAFEVKGGEVAVEMPLPPAGTTLVEPADEGTLVHLEGITHLVVTDPNPKQTPRELLSKLLKANKYNLNSHPAVGVSYFNPTTGKAEFCVWVREVATIFDETACGSGTCSIGIVLASKDKRSIEQDITQPSGQVIQTRTDYAPSGVTKSWISGKVEVLYDGEYKLQ
ncbi:MAG: Diaminopimelate epimerase [Chlamydiae bacterium]|nr:Diaminopimelate epimerase [Chlamydiota bacterium]